MNLTGFTVTETPTQSSIKTWGSGMELGLADCQLVTLALLHNARLAKALCREASYSHPRAAPWSLVTY